MATIVDHIVMRAAGGAVWDQSNWQAVCKSCHDIKSLNEKGYRAKVRVGIDGYPVHTYERISEEAERRRLPLDIPRSIIPVTLVCGAPGSGKSSYVKQNIVENDILIDLDVIMQQLTNKSVHEVIGGPIAQALLIRNRMLCSLAEDKTHRQAWFVIACPNPLERHTWSSMLGANVHVMETTLEECIARINRDDTRRSLHKQRMIRGAEEWFAINNYVTRARSDYLRSVPAAAMRTGG